jgi:hypothetical protein
MGVPCVPGALTLDDTGDEGLVGLVGVTVVAAPVWATAWVAHGPCPTGLTAATCISNVVLGARSDSVTVRVRGAATSIQELVPATR